MYLFYFQDLRGFDFRTSTWPAGALHRRRRARRGRAFLAGDASRQAPHLDDRQHRLLAGPDDPELSAQGRSDPGRDHHVQPGLPRGWLRAAGPGDAPTPAMRSAWPRRAPAGRSLYAMMTSVEKIASALSIGPTFTILSMVGYNAKEGARQHAGGDPQPRAGLPARSALLRHKARGACYIGYKRTQAPRRDPRRARRARPDALPGAGSASEFPVGLPEAT